MDPADQALRELANAAHDFALKWKPRPRITGAYARALEVLAEKARVFSFRSDEEWAGEVAALRAEIERLREPHE